MEKKNFNEKQANSLHNVQQQKADGQVNNQVVNSGEIVNNIVDEAVKQPSNDEMQREQRRRELAALRISSSTVVEPEVPTLTVDGVGLFALSDIHALKGKQKCGKTTALKVCLAAWLKGQQFRVASGLKEPRVLYLDTEQKETDVKKIIDDVKKMTGLSNEYIDGHLMLIPLRRRDQDQLLIDLHQLVDDYHPQVVVIDGIVEFVASFNDEAMAKQLIHDLLTISETSRLAMVCVLHTNKADDDHNMRGHLGTMLAQKAGTVLECKKDRASSVITVSCSDARHAEMPDWSIMFAEDGRIVDADERHRQVLEENRVRQKEKRQEASEKTKKERLDYALKAIRDHGGSISRKQLTAILCSKFELKRPTVSLMITQWREDGTLLEVNGDIHASNEAALAF
jgi:uncharacterized membrane protein